MTDYYIDSRATGAANGLTEEDAWTTIDQLEAGLPTNNPHTVNFIAGSGPYPLTGPFDGGGNDKTILGNGCIIDGSIDLNSSDYKWTQSTANPLEYYIEAAAGGDPSISTVTCGTIKGKFQENTAEEAAYQIGSAGSLSNEFIAYGDNDTLGYNTVYARYDAGLDAIEIKVSQQDHILDTNFINNDVYDLTFQYAGTAIIDYRAGSGTHTHTRCIYKFSSSTSSGNGVIVSAANNVTLNSCIGYFSGHRMASANSATAGDLTLNNCIDINSHLFLWMHGTYAGTLTAQNCIGYNESNGVIDLQSNATGTFTENNNLWYPTFNGGNALDYPDGLSTTWTATDVTDLPPSIDTDTSTRAAIDAAMVTAGYESGDPKFTNIDLRDFSKCDFTLQATSPCIDSGGKWWTGANPVGKDGEPFSDFDTSMGVYQSKDTPFHPINL